MWLTLTIFSEGVLSGELNGNGSVRGDMMH